MLFNRPDIPKWPFPRVGHLHPCNSRSLYPPDSASQTALVQLFLRSLCFTMYVITQLTQFKKLISAIEAIKKLIIWQPFVECICFWKIGKCDLVCLYMQAWFSGRKCHINCNSYSILLSASNICDSFVVFISLKFNINNISRLWSVTFQLYVLSWQKHYRLHQKCHKFVISIGEI